MGSKFLRSGNADDYASGVFKYTENSDGKIGGGQYFFATNFDFDASRASNLYQNGTNEVRVNGLFGLFLIRSY